MSDGKSVTTPLQQAWARVWAAKRDGDSREFESAMFAVVDADPSRHETIEQAHDLKTWPEYYSALEDGSKTFEIRNNDRGFAVGDVLRLREWNPVTRDYTGRELRRKVSYVLTNFHAIDGAYVVLGLAAVALQPRQEEIAPSVEQAFHRLRSITLRGGDTPNDVASYHAARNALIAAVTAEAHAQPRHEQEQEIERLRAELNQLRWLAASRDKCSAATTKALYDTGAIHAPGRIPEGECMASVGLRWLHQRAEQAEAALHALKDPQQ